VNKAGILATVLVLASAVPCLADSEYRPVVVVYAGGDMVLANMLVDLIEDDPRIDSDVDIVNSAGALAMSTALPTTECIVVYSNHKDQLVGLGTPLANFLQEGGGLVGLTEVGYEPSAGNLATEVFPVFGNVSIVRRSLREKRSRTYILNQAGDITLGLPETFDLISMGTYYSGDEEDNYLEITGGHEVVYRDGETGSPLVVSYEAGKGGRSVALPGVMVVKQDRVDVYYGNLLSDDNFVRLFTNSVYWAAKGSQRYPEVSANLSQKIADAETRYERAGEEADRAKREALTQRTMVLGAIWAVGLVGCGIIVWKVILAPVSP
jgi:hypothetical protein